MPECESGRLDGSAWCDVHTLQRYLCMCNFLGCKRITAGVPACCEHVCDQEGCMLPRAHPLFARDPNFCIKHQDHFLEKSEQKTYSDFSSS